jgi:hypothetical protein
MQKFFLLGTHFDAEEDQEPQQDDKIYVATVRVPKLPSDNKAVIDYSQLKPDHSQLKIVKEFSHNTDVSKVRAMP